MPKLTQKERVLKYLREAGPKGLDGSFFTYELHRIDGHPIPEYRTRISELEKEGYKIQRFSQEGSPYTRYVLLEENAQQQLF